MIPSQKVTIGLFATLSIVVLVQMALLPHIEAVLRKADKVILAAELGPGTIVTLPPDRGDRYVTTVLYCNERCKTAGCRVEHCRECHGQVTSP